MNIELIVLEALRGYSYDTSLTDGFLQVLRYIEDKIDENTEYVYIPGAFTNSVIADINPKKLKKVRFVLKNPTKIFLSAMDWGLWRKRGFRVNVLKNIEIAAITVNPWAPSGYTFDSGELVKAMQEALPDIPVIDVRV